MQKFSLSDKQSTALRDATSEACMTWAKKIEDELAEKIALFIYLNRFKTCTSERDHEGWISRTQRKYGDARRTEVHAGAIWEFNPTDTIPNEDVVVTFSKNGYIKRVKASSFRSKRRGGKGITTAVKDEDEIASILSTKNHNILLFFTNTGRVFRLPTYEIPRCKRTAKGQPIVQSLALAKDESVSAIIDLYQYGRKALVPHSCTWYGQANRYFRNC